MQTTRISNINFDGHLICHTKISNNTSKSSVPNFYAYFIELDPSNENDIKAIDEIQSTWENSRYIKDFAENFKDSKEDFNPILRQSPFYVLSSQTENYDILQPKKILGIVNTVELKPGYAYIEKIETNPEYQTPTREYSGIGSGMLSCLKRLYARISLISRPEKYVKDFYFKNDFIEAPKNSNSFTWYKC